MPYHRATEVALAALATSRCYFPGCHAPAAVTIEGEVVANLRRAHIRGKDFWGTRHDPAITSEQRDHWANLVLLCHPHHTWVAERHAERYTPDQLHEWKADREGRTAQGLTGLGRVTDADLDRIVRDAVRLRGAKMGAAVARLERSGEFELAAAVREIDRSTGVTPDASDVPHQRTAPPSETVRVPERAQP